jgi:hypothetical protein
MIDYLMELPVRGCLPGVVPGKGRFQVTDAATVTPELKLRRDRGVLCSWLVQGVPSVKTQISAAFRWHGSQTACSLDNVRPCISSMTKRRVESHIFPKAL